MTPDDDPQPADSHTLGGDPWQELLDRCFKYGYTIKLFSDPYGPARTEAAATRLAIEEAIVIARAQVEREIHALRQERDAYRTALQRMVDEDMEGFSNFVTPEAQLPESLRAARSLLAETEP